MVPNRNRMCSSISFQCLSPVGKRFSAVASDLVSQVETVETTRISLNRKKGLVWSLSSTFPLCCFLYLATRRPFQFHVCSLVTMLSSCLLSVVLRSMPVSVSLTLCLCSGPHMCLSPSWPEMTFFSLHCCHVRPSIRPLVSFIVTEMKVQMKTRRPDQVVEVLRKISETPTVRHLRILLCKGFRGTWNKQWPWYVRRVVLRWKTDRVNSNVRTEISRLHLILRPWIQLDRLGDISFDL